MEIIPIDDIKFVEMFQSKQKFGTIETEPRVGIDIKQDIGLGHCTVHVFHQTDVPFVGGGKVRLHSQTYKTVRGSPMQYT